MSSKRELVTILAKGYVEEYKRELGISKALNEFELYINDEVNPLDLAVEKVFNEINPYLVDCLLDLAESGYVSFEIDSGTETLSSVEEIIDILVI